MKTLLLLLLCSVCSAYDLSILQSKGYEIKDCKETTPQISIVAKYIEINADMRNINVYVGSISSKSITWMDKTDSVIGRYYAYKDGCSYYLFCTNSTMLLMSKIPIPNGMGARFFIQYYDSNQRVTKIFAE